MEQIGLNPCHGGWHHNLEMLEEIGNMYNEHPDFRKMWQTKYHQDIPEFLQRSIEYYCHHNQG